MTTVNELLKKMRERVGRVKRAVVLHVHAGVTKRTPVDTGRARGSWNVAINHVDSSTLPPVAAASGVSKALGGRGFKRYGAPRPAVGRIEAGDEVFVSNHLPYIAKLNDGSSKQAPAGFVQVAIEETKAAFAGLVAAVKAGA